MSTTARALRHALDSYENGVKAKDLMLEAGFHIALDPRFVPVVEDLILLLKELDIKIMAVKLDDQIKTQSKES